MSEIFLSYSRDDLAIARRFAEGLEREGFKVWWDQTLDPGEAYDHVTEKALKQAGAVVVLWSRKSVESRWVRAEATVAQRSKTLVPVMIEPCERPIMFELTQTADLSGWNGDPADPAWQAYVASLRRFLKKEADKPVGAETASVLSSVPARKPAVGLAVGVAALALLIAGAAWWGIGQRKNEAKVPAETADATAAAPAAADEVTLAVLPFADLSTAHDQETFSDGLTEEILSQLAQIKGLAVTGRTSSFAFKGKNEDLRVIAEKLDVTNLLEGSIRKEGNDLRITAQLISNGVHLWSKTYARQYADVFSLQEEIARDVAKALSITLGTAGFSRVEGGTNVPEALEKYLQAIALARQTRLQNIEPIRQLLREAVTLDPNFATAWLMLATYLMPLAGTTDAAMERERAEAIARGEALLPQDSLYLQSRRARELLAQRKWIEAEPIAVAVYDASSRSASGFAGTELPSLLLSVGRVREAVQLRQRMMRADPLAMLDSMSLQTALSVADRPAEAEAEYQRSRGLDGDHLRADLLALRRLMLDPRSTPAVVQARYRALTNAYPEMASARAAFDTLGDPEASRATARQQLERTQDQVSAIQSAFFADFVGDKDTAIAAVQRAADFMGQGPLNWAAGLQDLWYPFRTRLREDPRFKQVVRDLGLVEYWRAGGKWGDFCKPVGADDFECH